MAEQRRSRLADPIGSAAGLKLRRVHSRKEVVQALDAQLHKYARCRAWDSYSKHWYGCGTQEMQYPAYPNMPPGNFRRGYSHNLWHGYGHGHGYGYGGAQHMPFWNVFGFPHMMPSWSPPNFMPNALTGHPAQGSSVDAQAIPQMESSDSLLSSSLVLDDQHSTSIEYTGGKSSSSSSNSNVRSNHQVKPAKPQGAVVSENTDADFPVLMLIRPRLLTKPLKPGQAASLQQRAPFLVATGTGPHKKTIVGFPNKCEDKPPVSVVCACHGTTFSTSVDFVKHAEVVDAAQPLKKILVIKA